MKVFDINKIPPHLHEYFEPVPQIGLEATPADYVARMVEVFEEVRRVLKPEGTCWVNLGDSYASGKGTCHNPGGGKNSLGKGRKEACCHPLDRGNVLTLRGWGLKPKDLVGIPWMVAFAMRDAGWWLRSDIIWAKPNPMPESVRDRPTRAHEYVFLFAKSKRYYYDAEAIKEPAKSPYTKMPDGWDTGPGAHGTIHRNGRSKGKRIDKQRGHSRRHDGFNDRWDSMTRAEQQSLGANKRSVWTIPTQAYPEAHFATYPTKLIEPCILAGCPKGGIVLDPFAGSGTTGLVALSLGRRFVGIELNPEYVALAEKRINGNVPLFVDGER